MNNCWLQRLTLFVVSLICVVGSVQAGGNKYYYKAVAKVVPTGGGKVYAEVYINSGGSGNLTYIENEYSSEVTDGGGNESYCHFYAWPMEGYKFVKWTLDEAGTNQTGIQDAGSQHCYISVTNNSSGEENYKTTTCYAHFVRTTGMVKVAVDGDVGGTVSISNPDNKIDDEITITASPSGSYLFKGWYKHSGTTQTFITTDSPYTFTVSEQTTYYAHFESAQTDYCILKNVSSRKYLSLYGDYSATHPDNAYVFTNSLKTIYATEANNNPMIVFKRVAKDEGTEGYLSTDLSNSSGVITTNSLMGKYTPLTFTLQENGKYRISTTIDDVTYYLCDDGSDFVSLQSSNTNGSEWEITIMSANAGFGVNANAKYTKDGKYYTSLYAPFAYRLLDGVNAYYLDLDADNYDETTNTLTLSQISSGNVVPENMAVIIECSSANDPTGNQLLPVNEYTITDELKTKYDKNELRGYNQIVCQDNIDQYNEVSNDHDYMYVFSIKNNNLGFYHYSGNTIPKNKAYLKLSVTLENLSDVLNGNANTVKLAFGSPFGDDLLNSINLSDEEADDDDLPIFNLQGVQVKNPEKGIYIRGGKKFLVK